MRYIPMLIYIVTSALSVTLAKEVLYTVPVVLFLFARQLYSALVMYFMNRYNKINMWSEMKGSDNKSLWWLTGYLVFRLVNIILAYYCLSLIPSSIFSSLETPLLILVTLVINIIFLMGITIRKVTASLILLIGVVAVIGLDLQSVSIGILLLLALNGLSLYLSSICNSKLKGAISVNTIVTMNLLTVVGATGFIMLVGNLWLGINFFEGLDITPKLIIYFLVASTATLISNNVYTSSVFKIGHTDSTVLSCLTPVATVLISFVFFNEMLSVIQIVGVLTTVVAVMVYSTQTGYFRGIVRKVYT